MEVIKRTLISILALCFTLASSGQVISKSDSLSMVSKINDWNRTWKVKNHVLAAKWYAEDAEFTNAFGFSITGREAMEEYLAEVFKMDFVMAGESEQTSVKLKPISRDIVLVISTISRTGQKTSDNSDLGNRRTTHHRLFKKERDCLIVGHLISDARSTESMKH